MNRWPRVLTDLDVPQIDWWGERMVVYRRTASSHVLQELSELWKFAKTALSYDVVITANVRHALALGIAKRLLRRRRPRHLMVEMRLDDPRPDVLWRAKVRLQRWAMATVDVMCVSARREIELYAKRLRRPLAGFTFVPWHTNILEPSAIPAPAGHIFAAGRTGRDWKTFAAAVKNIAVPVVAICGRDGAAAMGSAPRARVLVDVPYEQYRGELAAARVVVVPLEPHVYSSGQVVVLEAMALGKPVVATRVLGTEDYIRHGVDGLLVAPEKPEELRAALDRILSDPELERTLAENAVKRIQERHTLQKYVSTIAELAVNAHQQGALDSARD